MNKELLIKIQEILEKKNKISEEYNIKYKHSTGNILDCLNLKEYHHSSLLAGILNYYTNEKPEILISFVQMLADKCNDIENIIQNLNKPKIETEQGRIDCLITDDKNYAIIIENKIYFATDQESQIERYVEFVQDKGIKNKNIFVVYLTKDGSKKIDDSSFTEKAKKILDYVDNEKNGRYIELNYKDDILPWLQTIILELKNKDHLFTEFIDQYIDKLKGEFRLRDIDKGEDALMAEELNKILEIEDKSDKEKLEKLTKTKKELETVQDTLNASIMAIIEPLFVKAFGDSVRNKFTNLKPKESIAGHYYQIFIEGFPTKFHFELMYDRDIPNITEFDIYLHDETPERKYKSKLDKDSTFKELFVKKGYTDGKSTVEVFCKTINLSDKLINVIDTEIPKIVEKEYEIMNDIAKYLIGKFISNSK